MNIKPVSPNQCPRERGSVLLTKRQDRFVPFQSLPRSSLLSDFQVLFIGFYNCMARAFFIMSIAFPSSTTEVPGKGTIRSYAISYRGGQLRRSSHGRVGQAVRQKHIASTPILEVVLRLMLHRCGKSCYDRGVRDVRMIMQTVVIR